MNTKYCPGDIVRIREDLDEETIYPMDGFEHGISANDKMVSLRGEFTTIKRVFQHGFCGFVYVLDIDRGAWSWTDAMFEDNQPTEDIAAEPLNDLYDWILTKNM